MQRNLGGSPQTIPSSTLRQKCVPPYSPWTYWTARRSNGVYADRVIDIDLLLCFAEDDTPVRMDTEKLTLPHPLMRQREFVMVPLREIIGSEPEPFSTSYTSVVRR